MTTEPRSQSQAPEDPFATLLTLEDTLYTTAYASGLAAGARAGKIEGRIFGLEKGFDKFAALGALHGRSVVWGARLPPKPGHEGSKNENENEEQEEEKSNEVSSKAGNASERGIKTVVPPLPALARLPPHITLLHSLSDPPTFSTANTEDAVADFDDRFKRGTAKAKIIELLIKEPSSAAALSTFASGEGDRSPMRKMRVAGEGAGKQDNMEDFVGSRLLR